MEPQFIFSVKTEPVDSDTEGTEENEEHQFVVSGIVETVNQEEKISIKNEAIDDLEDEPSSSVSDFLLKKRFFFKCLFTKSNKNPF